MGMRRTMFVMPARSCRCIDADGAARLNEAGVDDAEVVAGLAGPFATQRRASATVRRLAPWGWTSVGCAHGLKSGRAILLHRGVGDDGGAASSGAMDKGVSRRRSHAVVEKQNVAGDQASACHVNVACAERVTLVRSRDRVKT